MKTTAQKTPPREAGIAIVLVLGMLVVMTSVSIAFVQRAGIGLSATQTRGDNLRAQYLAESAVNHAMWLLINDKTFPAASDTYYMHTLAGGRYGYKVRRHTYTTFATVAAVGAVGESVVHKSYVIHVWAFRKLYWYDKTTTKIRRSDFDGANVEDLVSGIADLKLLKLDLEGRKMYWADKGTDKIHRADLDGANAENLVSSIKDPKALVLDVAGGKMYWANKDKGKIQRSDLDGSNVEDLVSGIWDPKALKLDVAGGKMYWAN